MFRALQRSSILKSVSAKAFAQTSIQAERYISTKKAVVFNLRGSVVPALSHVVKKFARDHNMSESEMMAKLFKEGDKSLLKKIEPALLSRHGSFHVALAELVSAIQGIRAEGIKTGLILDAGDLNPAYIPIDTELFDVTSPALKPAILDQLKVDSTDVVYVDNVEKNLKAAQSLGMTTIKVENIESALRDIEASLQVPLKEFLPGFTWIYWDNANSPYKNTKENLLYYLLVIYVFMVSGHLSLKYVFKVDGTQQH
ncbi:uncharacterized protein LOC100199013 [Hydra vulgaris]|uniref:uncharacterized protein LOC100199013 n=1 Tax=Hydra vulgaris TaxID=6087 RepID=UPI0001926A1C|nr:uncharacterized protein LOC100199013 [Hydra vulgaris]